MIHRFTLFLKSRYAFLGIFGAAQPRDLFNCPPTGIAPVRFRGAAQASLQCLHRQGRITGNLAATYALVAQVDSGASISSEASANKIFWSEMDRTMHRTAMTIMGMHAELEEGDGAIENGRWLDGYMFSLAGPIYAGTNEIQRNILAERVLGLPRQ